MKISARENVLVVASHSTRVSLLTNTYEAFINNV